MGCCLFDVFGGTFGVAPLRLPTQYILYMYIYICTYIELYMGGREGILVTLCFVHLCFSKLKKT